MLRLVHDAQAQLVNEVSLEDSNFSNMSKKIISQRVFVEVVWYSWAYIYLLVAPDAVFLLKRRDCISSES